MIIYNFKVLVCIANKVNIFRWKHLQKRQKKKTFNQHLDARNIIYHQLIKLLTCRLYKANSFCVGATTLQLNSQANLAPKKILSQTWIVIKQIAFVLMLAMLQFNS